MARSAPRPSSRRRSTAARRTSGCTRSASRRWGGFIFLNLIPRGRAPGRTLRTSSAARWTGCGTTRWRSCARRASSIDVAANWKVILENYNECYHCGPVHPELCRVVPAFKQKGGADARLGSRRTASRGRADLHHVAAQTNRAPFPGLDEDERVLHKGELMYPNFMLSLFDGARGGVYRSGRERPGADHRDLRFPLPSRRDGPEPDFDPCRRGGFLGHDQSPGLDDVRGGAARDGRSRRFEPGTTRRWRV